ncbi:MAG: class I SAM-dependent methyltransferase [Dehalococcoidia bacterium]
MSSIGILGWLVLHPKHWVDIPSVIKQRLTRGERAENRALANEQCRERAVPVSTLTELVPGFQLVAFDELYRPQVEEARSRCAASPVSMGGAADLSLIFSLAEAVAAVKVVETGVAYGWSSLALLSSLSRRPGSLLISVDRPYPGLKNDPYVGIAVPDEYRANWRLLRESDRRGIPQALELAGAPDICHYDSDKSYEGRMWGYRRLWNALRPGGLLVSDDISDNTAFLDFADRTGAPSSIVASGSKFVGVIVKPPAQMPR